MKRASALAVLLFAACLAASAAAADLYVIANTAVELQPDDVRDVFLGEKQFAGSVRLHPVDNAAAQEAFLSRVMRLSSAAYATAWTKKAFRQGLTQPPLHSSDAEVLEFVRRTEGAVGYVGRTPPAGVKVLQKLAN